MAPPNLVTLPVLLALITVSIPLPGLAQLSTDFYANICPDVDNIVRGAVTAKFQETFVTAQATIRLFFHDCFVEGCDASVLIQSTADNTAEKDNPINLSLAGDGFDTVTRAKAAVDAVPQCRNQVSCADILALATRDAIVLAGGPSYAVELGRRDGLTSTSASVDGKLPEPTFNLDQLTSLFALNGISQTDMIALSGAHTVGFAHCNKFANRIFNFSETDPVDPTLNSEYAQQLQVQCPRGVDPSIVIGMDPVSPTAFDNQYFTNLQQGKGLFTSDEVLFTDPRSKPLVDIWAADPNSFNAAFVTAITNLGRVGVKTGSQGNVRFDCTAFN